MSLGTSLALDELAQLLYNYLPGTPHPMAKGFPLLVWLGNSDLKDFGQEEVNVRRSAIYWAALLMVERASSQL